MRTRFQCLLTVVFALSFAGGCATTTEPANTRVKTAESSVFSGYLGSNLLKNANFENELYDWLVPVGASWGKDNSDNGVLILQAETPPNDRFIHETRVAQCVLLGPGESYTLAAKFFSSVAHDMRRANKVEVVWFSSDDCTNGGQYGGRIIPRDEPVNSWQQLNEKRLTPMLGAKAALIRVTQNGRYSVGSASAWDDIYFAPNKVFLSSEPAEDSVISIDRNPLGVNYLENPNFDKTFEGWRPSWPTVWSKLGQTSSSGSAEVTASSTSGSKGRAAFSQCVNLAGNDLFTAGISYSVNLGSTQRGGGRFRVTWFGGKNCTGRARTSSNHADVDKEAKAGWHAIGMDNLRAPPNSKSVSITAIQSILGEGEFVVNWDNAFFIATD